VYRFFRRKHPRGLWTQSPSKGVRFSIALQGEHDTHWYVRFGEQTLHIVDGYAWHAGLPLEGLLAGSTSVEVRGWEFGDAVGLDLSGQLSHGRRWRWVGAPLADAVSYEAAIIRRLLPSLWCASSGGRTLASGCDGADGRAWRRRFLNFALGRRDIATTHIFIDELRGATSARQKFQITPDCFEPYIAATTDTLDAA
jgi:hypothetical protein